MNKVKIFNSEEFGAVRTVTINGNHGSWEKMLRWHWDIAIRKKQFVIMYWKKTEG